MKQIAVIGSGTMGNGIAHTFAQAGFTVKLIDISEKSSLLIPTSKMVWWVAIWLWKLLLKM
jgi:3-hydroxyacyl-CoA dehydrogenase